MSNDHGEFMDPEAFRGTSEFEPTTDPIKPQGEEVVELGTLRLLNESSVKKYALKCSKEIRLGKFRRVGEDFMNEVQADVEAFVRGLDVGHGVSNDEMVVYESGFTTGALCAKLREKCELVIAKIIQRKVKRMPSVGVTLGRTR